MNKFLHALRGSTFLQVGAVIVVYKTVKIVERIVIPRLTCRECRENIV